MPFTALRNSSRFSTRKVAFAPMPAGGFRTIGKPTFSANPRASVSDVTRQGARRPASPAARRLCAFFIDALSRNSSATSGRVAGDVVHFTHALPPDLDHQRLEDPDDAVRLAVALPEDLDPREDIAHIERLRDANDVVVKLRLCAFRRRVERGRAGGRSSSFDVALTKRMVVSIGNGATKITLRGMRRAAWPAPRQAVATSCSTAMAAGGSRSWRRRSRCPSCYVVPVMRSKRAAGAAQVVLRTPASQLDAVRTCGPSRFHNSGHAPLG